MDLADQLTSGGKDEGGGIGLASAAVRHVGGVVGWGRLGTCGEGGGENREEEATSFTGTSLGTGHQVTLVGDDGDGVLLDGGRVGVVGELDVLD